MLIRGTLCIILVILSLLPAIPIPSQTGYFQSGHQTSTMPFVAAHDPNGTAYAFNATRSQFDLYTLASAVTVGTAPPTPVSNTFNNSQTGAGVSGTSFNVTIASSTLATENVTWNRIVVPKGNVSSTTYLRFDWRGTIGNSTKASYFVYNETGHPAFSNFISKNITSTITGGKPDATLGSPPVGCGPTDNCIDVTKYIGFNLTLTFRFDSNSTGTGLNINVNNVALVSADALPINTYSHSMGLDPTDPTRMTVNHNADLRIPTGYFANVTYPRPNGQSGKLNHTWSQMILSFYYPNSYTQVKISQNDTSIFPTISPASPILQGNCPTFFFCRRDSHIVSLNMTSGIKNALIIISADSVNLSADVKTTLGGVPTAYWGAGDLLQVKVTLRQGVNVTGSNTVSGNKTGLVRVTQTFTNVKEGISLENFTEPIPQDTSLLGLWTVNSTFINGYDYGFNSTTFTLEQLGVTGFTYSGTNRQLNAGGTLTYASNLVPAPSVNGYVFAIDSGSGAAPITNSIVTPGTGMYVSNVTLLNGVFTSGSQLIMTFTLVNPTGISMRANLTIDHEWASNTPHGSNATIAVPSGAGTFTLQPDYVYRLNATFTPSGIRIIVTGTSSGGNSISATLQPGNPPVTSLRQHPGLFKITVTSKPASSSVTSPCVPSCGNSLESPVYAYVLVNPPLPGRLLASASFASIATGSFSTIISGKILGATKLVFLSLGRDPNGLAITVQGASTQESTLLQSSLDPIPTATENQPLTIILHLTSTSRIIDMNIAISLNVEGQGIVQTRSGILITHGTKQDVSFNFNAPPNVGVFTLTFFSPDYGAPLIAGTLQVSLLQGTLQVLIPAIIGVLAAIVILLFFLFRRKPQTMPEPSPRDKPSGSKPTKPNPGSSSSKSLT